MKQLLDELIDLTQNQTTATETATVPMASPPRGRRRSYSTHNDRSMLLIELDQQWKNYDKDPVVLDMSDGSPKVDKPLRRKRSSKRVTIAAEPIVLDEKSSVTPIGEELPKQPSFRRKPVLKRQSAEEDIEVSLEVAHGAVFEENETEKGSNKVDDDGDKVSNRTLTHNRTFERQRYNMIRKREDGNSSRTRKREKFRRQNSSNYRQRMQTQVSFDEEAEEQDVISADYSDYHAAFIKAVEEDADLNTEEHAHNKRVYFEHRALSPSVSSDTPLIASDNHLASTPSVEYKIASATVRAVDEVARGENDSSKTGPSTDPPVASNKANLNFKHVVYI